MFNTDDILALAKAGFSAKQIHALSKISTTPSIAPEPKSREEVEKNLQESMQKGDVIEIQNSINALADMMKFNNVINSQMPKEDTAEDILASILTPDGGDING